MERALLRLLLALLKLLFQLVVFIATGAWPKFEKRVEQTKPATGHARPVQKQPKRARPEQAARAPRGKKQREAPLVDGPWPFEFAPELSDPEPMLEAGRTDQGRARVAERRVRAMLNVPALTSVRGARRSIASALRDRRTVREALVLGTALAPRPLRRPPRG